MIPILTFAQAEWKEWRQITPHEPRDRAADEIQRVLCQGPQGGTLYAIQRTAKIEDVAFLSETSDVKRRLRWHATIQDTWERDVFKRGLHACLGPLETVLWATKLHTRHFETFEVVVLEHGRGYSGKTVRGFLFRHHGTFAFSTSRKNGARNIRNLIAGKVLAAMTPNDDPDPHI